MLEGQKQSLKCVFGKRCSKSSSNEITLPDGLSPVNFLHTIRTPFYKNISGEILLKRGNTNITFELSRVSVLPNLD